MWVEPRIQITVANILMMLAIGVIAFSLTLKIPDMPIFAIHKVRISGNLQHLTREQLQLVITKDLRGNLLTLDIDRLRDGFVKLPWVDKVSVSRAWPEAVNIVVAEHDIFARWGSDGLVDSSGKIFSAASNAFLPIFNGPKDSVSIMLQHYAEYNRILSPLGFKVHVLDLSQRMSWEIVLENGLLIKLGEQADEQRLQRFVDVYSQTVGKLPVMPSDVDLRYSNGFAMRLPASVKKQAVAHNAALEKKNG
ncbi:MAG TPA: cell division protein FtsQ/DivIB [Burkholderiales bacterium]|nr:cell division protein FtsQ/DivIB [Burkholderiales bacterium]